MVLLYLLADFTGSTKPWHVYDPANRAKRAWYDAVVTDSQLDLLRDVLVNKQQGYTFLQRRGDSDLRTEETRRSPSKKPPQSIDDSSIDRNGKLSMASNRGAAIHGRSNQQRVASSSKQGECWRRSLQVFSRGSGVGRESTLGHRDGALLHSKMGSTASTGNAANSSGGSTASTGNAANSSGPQSGIPPIWVHTPKTGSSFALALSRDACPTTFERVAAGLASGRRLTSGEALMTDGAASLSAAGGAAGSSPFFLRRSMGLLRGTCTPHCTVSHGPLPLAADERRAVTIVRDPRSRILSSFLVRPHALFDTRAHAPPDNECLSSCCN